MDAAMGAPLREGIRLVGVGSGWGNENKEHPRCGVTTLGVPPRGRTLQPDRRDDGRDHHEPP